MFWNILYSIKSLGLSSSDEGEEDSDFDEDAFEALWNQNIVGKVEKLSISKESSVEEKSAGSDGDQGGFFS